mmetsp:Transcript_13197/g.31111  ORF Transcript_13197/g.31111 Transcript_13197/m.31111 type:complete len:292 (+) Transcript_13197:1105-1980(+)
MPRQAHHRRVDAHRRRGALRGAADHLHPHVRPRRGGALARAPPDAAARRAGALAPPRRACAHHRVRPAALCARRGPRLPPRQHAARAHAARGGARARGGAALPLAAHHQHPGLMDQDGPCRLHDGAAGGRQRPGRHADERAHLPRGGRLAWAGDEPRGHARPGRGAPAGRWGGAAHDVAAHHDVRGRRRGARPGCRLRPGAAAHLRRAAPVRPRPAPWHSLGTLTQGLARRLSSAKTGLFFILLLSCDGRHVTGERAETFSSTHCERGGDDEQHAARDGSYERAGPYRTIT